MPPLFEPGLHLMYDRYGNIVDPSASLIERACILGLAWRIDTGYTTLAADGDYTLINFKTPATGTCYYTLASIDKSGNEVIVSLIRAGTVAAGTEGVGFNYDDNVTTACPLTDITLGGTVADGVERFESLLPGTGTPATKTGGTSRALGLIKLRPDTMYSVKLLAKGGAVTLAGNVGIAYYPTA